MAIPTVYSTEAEVPEHSDQPGKDCADSTGRLDASVLEDRMPAGLKTSRAAAGMTLVLGLLYLALSYGSLWHTDVWGHLSYGRWIVDSGRLPVTEPLMPLSSGVPFVDTAWLSQVGSYLLWSQYGTPALQFLYAATISAVAALLAGAVYRRTGSSWAGLLAVLVFGVVDYHQLLIIRPQLAGMVCFAAAFCMATSFRWKTWYWVAIPATFALWANLHGSFVVGLAMLAALAFGRAADYAWRTRSLRAVFRDRQFRRLALVTELAAAAVLLNPYGIELYLEAFSVAGNPNLNDLIEWAPLTLRMSQGRAMAIAAIVLVGLYRLSPRRIGTGELLLLVGFGCAAMWTSRLIVWWAPLAGYYIGLHGAAVWKRLRRRAPAEPRRAGLWTVVSVGLAWIFFAYTPFGMKVVHGKPHTEKEIAAQLRKSVSSRTPLGIAEFLAEHPPQGQIFNTYEWGDYLLWAGPKDLQVFVASHAHLVPREVWQDYMQIAYAVGDWRDKLDRYGVNTVVLDRTSQPALTRQLKRDEGWEKTYEDGIGAVFVRRRPI